MGSPQLQAVAPILSVDDLPAALEWYQRVLGFAVAWRWGDPVGLASVCRDSVELNLGQRGQYGPPGPSQVYVRVTGIDAYCDQVRRAGGAIRAEIEDRAYGMRDFRVEDASGNLLDFGEQTDSSNSQP